jgi:hypothetical protein
MRIKWNLAFLLSVVLLAATTASAQAPPVTCANSSLHGNYGLFLVGADSSGNAVASSGQITASGTGTLTGVWTEGISGTFRHNVPLTGTYSVTAGCTGKLTIRPQGQSALHVNVVVSSTGTHFDMIVSDPGNTRSGFADAQGGAVCSNAGVAGKWGIVQTDGFIVGIGLGAYMAQLNFDGTATVTINGTFAVNGDIQKTQASGPYSVGANCMGTLNFGGIVSDFVVVGSGKEAIVISENPNTVGIAVARR